MLKSTANEISFAAGFVKCKSLGTIRHSCHTLTHFYICFHDCLQQTAKFDNGEEGLTYAAQSKFAEFLHQLCESPVGLQCICNPFGSCCTDCILLNTVCGTIISQHIHKHSNDTPLKQSGEKKKAHFRTTSLRLHCSTSARA